jgi:hypothetical protein
VPNVSAQQATQIFKIYYRFKAYEYEIKKYFSKSAKGREKGNQASD